MDHRYVWTPHQVIAYYHTQQLGRCNCLYGFLFYCYSWDIRRNMPQKQTQEDIVSYHSSHTLCCYPTIQQLQLQSVEAGCQLLMENILPTPAFSCTLSSPLLFRCSPSHKNEVTSRNVFHSEQIHNLFTCFQFHVLYLTDQIIMMFSTS